ncbi:hypothetical protein J6590_072437 [Homalodisca vitripennis]|nr:hypothetical protein J6590_072437 [Homalodisca vitripennis]
MGTELKPKLNARDLPALPSSNWTVCIHFLWNKEDLHFELLARGLTPGSDCESMRKQLRDNMDLDTTWPRDLTFQKQRPILEAKLETFENSQEDWL